MIEDTSETHESYGIISFSRISHGGKSNLFGSSIRDHHITIRLTISRASVIHDGHHDRYRELHPSIVEVEMSAHQFSELITTMNIGVGVPCTIRRVGKEGMQDPEFIELESEKIVTSFEKNIKKLMLSVTDKIKEIRPILTAKGPLKVRDKAAILELLQFVERELISNAPFAAEMFKEATERMINTAKSEVDAFLGHVINKAGLSAIKEMKMISSDVDNND